MTTLLFLLEEPSARDLLEGLLPRLLPGHTVLMYLVFEGKQDLERNVTRKIQGWQRPDTRFVVLRDQDAGDCRAVKAQLASLVPPERRSLTTIRVACRELESWALGDWAAVAKAFDRPRLTDLDRRSTYRSPDALHNPVVELRKHVPSYQKRDGARRLGPLLTPERNRSRSFQLFCRTIITLAH
ncbi:MAG: DUF4276 family protein [Planctomycetes bacterium]|nr:DUF4276 family protein [Planctomycetota bacterium]